MEYEIYAQFRISQKMKDSDVAKLAGIPQSTFSDWKKGKSSPKAEKLEKIRFALGISASDFYGYKEMEISAEEIQMSLNKQFEHLEAKRKELDFISKDAIEFAKQWDELDEESKKQLTLMLAFLKSKKQDN